MNSNYKSSMKAYLSHFLLRCPYRPIQAIFSYALTVARTPNVLFKAKEQLYSYINSLFIEEIGLKAQHCERRSLRCGSVGTNCGGKLQ